MSGFKLAPQNFKLAICSSDNSPPISQLEKEKFPGQGGESASAISINTLKVHMQRDFRYILIEEGKNSKDRSNRTIILKGVSSLF